MTRRESEILEALQGRRTNGEIAAQLYLSERTVESHVSSLMRKLHAVDRRELADIAAEVSSGRAPQGAVLPGPLALAAAAGALVGRSSEQRRLREVWKQAVGGDALAIVVTGEAGMGKSRLVADFAAEVHGQGAKVLFGACFEDSQVPYEPFSQALTADVALMSGAPDDRRGVVLEILRRMTDIAPVLLVLEDLHWATPTTRDALRYLVRRAGRIRLMIVATCRDTAPDLQPEIRILLGDLARGPNSHRIVLIGLDEASIVELAASAEPDLDVDVDIDVRLIEESGGNPLFALAMLRSSGRHHAATSLDALLAERARRLSEEDNELLDLAAVLGAEFDAALVGAVSRTSLDSLLGMLERAEGAGLATLVPGGRGRWAFVHALFRRARYDAIPTARRLRLHRDVARVLARRTETAAVDAVQLAHHAYIACRLGEARLAVDACTHAGDLAAQSSAAPEAVAQYRRALDAADLLDPPDPALTSDLQVRLGATLHNAGSAEGAPLLLQAAVAARARRDADALATIAWSLSYYGSGLAGSPSPTIIELADEALALAGPDPSRNRARMLGLRAGQHAMAGEMGRAANLVDESLRVARAIDDPTTLGQALMTARMAVWTPDSLDQRLAIAGELASVGDTTGTRAWSIVGRQGLASLRRERGDLAGSFRALDEVDALIGATPPIWAALLWVAMRANRHFLLGDLHASEQVASEFFGLDLHAGAGPTEWVDPATWHSAHILAVRYYQGRLAELTSRIEQLPFGPATRAIASCALADAGDHDRARERLDDDLRRGFGHYPADSTWLVAMCWLAEAADITGHRPMAAALDTRLAPYGDRLDNYGDGAYRPVRLALAQTALVLGDVEHALRRAETTIAWCRREGAPLFLGRALVQLAAARAQQGEIHQDAVHEAIAIASRTGADLIVQDAARYGLC